MAGGFPVAWLVILLLTITSCDMSDSVPVVSVAELAQKHERGEPFFLLDVRTRVEAEAGRLAFTDALIPYDVLPDHLTLLPADKTTPIYCFCRSGRRSGISTAFLKSIGYREVYNVTGGIIAWNDATLPLTAGQLPPDMPIVE